MRRPGNLADGVVDVAAERVAAGVPVEERRKDLERKRGGHEERVALQGAQDHLAKLPRLRRVFRQLQILFGSRRLRAGSHPAVDPRRLREQVARVRHLVASEHVGYLDKHVCNSEC